MFIYIITLILILTFIGCDNKGNLIISSQDQFGTIAGYVFDKKSNTPLFFAKVSVVEQNETFSDSSGYFQIDSTLIGAKIIVTHKNFYEYDTTQIVVVENDTSNINILLEPLRIISYRIVSTVTKIGGIPPFEINPADTISGLISYQIDTQDIFISDRIKGYYPQIDKSCQANFLINKTPYINSWDQDTLFYIGVQNDYYNAFNYWACDEIYFGPFIDTQLKDLYSLTRLRLIIDLQDNTQKVLSDDKIPINIDLDRFNMRLIWIDGRTIDAEWNIEAEINKFYFEMPNTAM